MNVLLRPGLIGFPHLVDRRVSSSCPTPNGGMIGLPSRNAGGRSQSRPPSTPFPSSQTNYCWSKWFILSDRLPVLHAAAGTGLVYPILEEPLFSHTQTHNHHQSCVSPLPSPSLPLSLPLISFFPSSSPLSRVPTSLINRRDPFLSFGLWAVVLLLPFLPSFTLLDSYTGSFVIPRRNDCPCEYRAAIPPTFYSSISTINSLDFFFPCSNF
ncbi:hypothetical protein BDV32DRAFT_10255 [Aspergillus pseudonomiae]|nr:hypothetical protein BDV32DRAFT_10255 [Aspergillus pseudonomiae]